MHFFFFSLYLLQKPKTSLSLSHHILFLFFFLLLYACQVCPSLLFLFSSHFYLFFWLINVSLFLFLFIFCLIDFYKTLFLNHYWRSYQQIEFVGIFQRIGKELFQMPMCHYLITNGFILSVILKKSSIELHTIFLSMIYHIYWWKYLQIKAGNSDGLWLGITAIEMQQSLHFRWHHYLKISRWKLVVYLIAFK